MTRRYYAACKPHGDQSPPAAGPGGALLVGFDRKAARDAWVAADDAHREALASSDDAVRAALRFEERTGYRVIRAVGEWSGAA